MQALALALSTFLALTLNLVKPWQPIQIVDVKVLAGHISMKNSICIPMDFIRVQKLGDLM